MKEEKKRFILQCSLYLELINVDISVLTEIKSSCNILPPFHNKPLDEEDNK